MLIRLSSTQSGKNEAQLLYKREYKPFFRICGTCKLSQILKHLFITEYSQFFHIFSSIKTWLSYYLSTSLTENKQCT